MDRVTFDGRQLPGKRPVSQMRDVDFSSATFNRVWFRGYEFVGVALPDVPGVYEIRNYPVVARKVLKIAQESNTKFSTKLQALLKNELKLPGDDSSSGVFNRADYVSLDSQGFADFVETAFMQSMSDL